MQHLLTDSDCESVPELVGDWSTDGDLNGTWALTKLGDHNYRLLPKNGQSETSNKQALDISVAHLGRYLFFDATSREVQPDGKNAILRDDDSVWI